MSEENNHIIFTAANIEKYHKGQLSAKEMHDMEKAALDDPFLAGALEGYAFAGADVNADLAELKKRLSERTEKTKVIPIAVKRHNTSFPFLRIAAIVIVIAGAGLITYQLAFTNRSKDIAQIDLKKTEEIKAIDSSLVAAPAVNEKDKATTTITERPKQDYSIAEKNKEASVTHQSVGAGAVKKDTAVIVYSISNNDQAKRSVTTETNLFEKTPQPLTVNNEADKKDLTKKIEQRSADEKESAPAGYTTNGQLNKLQNDNVSRSSGIAINRQAETDNQQSRNNIFRGRVMDASNNPVPFANITNTQDRVGTYSDAKGYFNLLSPDSVMDVQIRSIGFENNTAQLRNSVSNNQVVMQDDRNSLSEVVISNRKPNASLRSRNTTMKLEEPEPADGWDNYDVYLANNINVPDEIKTKQSTGDVEVSLEVNKNGDPINIKIEKSLCDKCDAEAIRLIKEGPRWNRKSRKGRALIKVSF